MALANAFSPRVATVGPNTLARQNLTRSNFYTTVVRSSLPFNTTSPKQFGGRVRYATSRAAIVCVAQVEEASQNVETLSDTNGAEAVAHRPFESTAAPEDSTPSPSSTEEVRSHDSAQPERSHRRGRGRDNRTPRGGARSGKSLALTAQDPRRAPCPEHNLKRGDVVAGRVIRSTPKGSNIELLEDPRIVGFAPSVEGPFLMRDRVTSLMNGVQMPVGLVREFRIKAIPEDMEYYGKGPLLSAKDLDLDTLWDRAFQIKTVCDEDLECVKVKVTEANAGGMLATLESLPAFIPYSLVAKPSEDAWLSHDEMREHYIGKEVQVCIKDVSPENRKVVLDGQRASHNKVLKQMQVGGLVWGTVRRVEPYGVFIGIDGTKFSGLLHISSISRAHVENVEEVFSVGERVRAMLVGMEGNFSRISLSTAELEATSGDMLYAKDLVYEGAEEQAKEAVKKMQQREKDDEFYGNNGSGGDQGFDFDNRRR